jgi:pre-mRNA-processing factor SLU7
MSRSQPPKPPAQDTSRNEYIPAFISKAPFWAEQTDGDYLEHQRLHAAPKDTLDKAKWYDRGKKLGPAATKFRKGACENCGALTHKTKECLSRPRKQGAKWTGRDIQADEVVDSVQLGWDAKRDRWNGYDAREYNQVIRDFEDLETLKKATSGTPQNDTNGSNTPDPDSDARYAEETDMGRSQPTSTRQLRLREDTAKYLLDLNPDSAKYDPKTRSMDTTSQALSKVDASGDIASEGFVRPHASGTDAEAFERAQKYAWETQESASIPAGQRLHLQANPTAGAILMKKHEEEIVSKKASREAYLRSKYGDHITVAQASTSKTIKSISASESYTEYDETGVPKNAPPKGTAKSKYPEDILANNHASVWGSWWHNFTWGYACCHSNVKNSYCTGDAGRLAFEEEERMKKGVNLITEDNGEEEVQEDDQREQKTDAEAKKEADKSQPHERYKKRTLEELQGITSEEMENYKRSKISVHDPMASVLGKDELV